MITESVLPNGKTLDIHTPDGADATAALPTLLLWHGIGPDERDILRPVAQAVAAAGAVVLVPDWRSDEPDGGRAHLLCSLGYAQERTGIGPLVVAGWSAGAGAAVGLATRPTANGWRPSAVVGIAGRYDVPARTTGTAPLDDLATRSVDVDADPIPVHLVHGTEDVPVDIRCSREFAAALGGHGWPVDLEEPASDHAGVIMGAYDPAVRRIVPSGSAAAVAGGKATVAALLTALSLPLL
ncbi:alpha/beta hydrolase [Streptomyces sp. UNOC14_S4]|uniref:alpha/beta hydrolase n=1 Tax=Streptomyces sp. UNOC14_S4 TaxID=2872340 RepID=UPI001E5DCDF3|nr:alpha/beta hydrolase [Streptomyces sp. UNOC14_S4]MCC3767831.1 alpha/beta hydrolase [Streptomyces sp. UNOC14_S4]